MSEETKLTITITKIIYRDYVSGFTITKVDINHTENKPPTTEPVVVGNFHSILEDDNFEVWGEWVKHPKYGIQFSVDRSMRIYPATLQGQEVFLTKAIKGVGPNKSKAIVKKFGINTIDTIKEQWESLLGVPGIGKTLAQDIHKQITSLTDFDAVAMFLLGIGISYKQAIKIYNLWGSEAIDKIKKNPYCLCDIKGIAFKYADRYAKNLYKSIKLDSPYRIEAALVFSMEELKNKGHTYYPKAPLISYATKLLNTEDFIIEDFKIYDSLENLINQGKFIEENECIYLDYVYNIEIAIAKKVKYLVNTAPKGVYRPETIENAIKRFENKNQIDLDSKQKQAIHTALTSGFSVLTGGPGTGKTMTINAIIECLYSIEKNSFVKLAAPTGKAAKRMSEMTGYSASTIHRLLELKKGKQVEENQLAVDFLILDESSMIDLWVAQQLSKAIAPGTRVLFVGDADQLPPVSYGNVFHDLISSKQVPVCVLDTIFRQAQESQIVMNAHAIIRNKHKEITFDKSKNDFYFISCQDKQKAAFTIVAAVQRLIKLGYNMSDIQILSPIRKGDLGVNVINSLVQDKFNPFQDKNKELKFQSTIFRIGDKVMQIRNNYSLEVFNGETGIITDIVKGVNEDGSATVNVYVNFGDRAIIYDYEEIEDLVLSYCTTIHKSQGSEYQAIIIPVHNTHVYHLHRNLVYTGITRAKEKVVLVGTKKAFYIGINKKDSNLRYSSLADRLIELMKKETSKVS